MSTDLQVWSPERISLIQRTIAPTVTKDEFEFFIARCKQSGLDPIARQIYAISRYDKQASGNKMTIQVSIDGMRLLAERSGKYAGQVGPLWCGEDMEWKEVWLSTKPPLAAKVGVIRSDFKEPLYAVAKFSSYAQSNKDGNLTPLWAKMPDLMLAKCAESLALRRAFPAETSGFYTRDEMAQAERDLPATVLAQEAVEGEVIEETQEVHEPLTLGKLFVMGKERGLWSDTSVGKFYSLASAVLGGIPINKTTKLDQGQLLQLQAAIEQEVYAGAGVGK